MRLTDAMHDSVKASPVGQYLDRLIREGGSWEMSSANLAGWMNLSFTVNPEFIREHDGKIVAYQPGKCIEMTLTGAPYIWHFSILQTDIDPISAVA